LGSLPSAELETYKNVAIKPLYRKLHECNEKLKKYSHVNKKALDQYVSFSEQRTELLQRKKELDEGAQAIEKLITNLDRQKDEAIIRTFRGECKLVLTANHLRLEGGWLTTSSFGDLVGVSMHFKDVFNELVPNGYGRMVMKTTADQTKELGGEGEDGGDGGEELSVSEFVWIQIQVSFTGTGDRYLMQQLSGMLLATIDVVLPR